MPLPKVRYGKNVKKIAWKKADPGPDDDEQTKTPADVIAMLGFDPVKEFGDE